MQQRDGLDQSALEKRNARLAEEMERRGQPLPEVPEIPPQPTEGATYRASASKALDVASGGAGISQ